MKTPEPIMLHWVSPAVYVLILTLFGPGIYALVLIGMFLVTIALVAGGSTSSVLRAAIIPMFLEHDIVIALLVFAITFVFAITSRKLV